MNINTLHHNSDNWPISLNHISPPISQLHVAGEGTFKGPMIAMIGSRRPSAYGRNITQRLAAHLAGNGVQIVSGLAIGIDSIAHSAALEAGGSTIGVLPSPIDSIYPCRHRALAKQITARGLLVSEYPAGESVRKHHFIARNRIIAGLADAIIVTEATHKSGTLHTVNFALSMGKEIGAVPGPIDSELSAGANRLIRDGAHAITSVSDVWGLLGVSGPSVQADQPQLSGIEYDIYCELKNHAYTLTLLNERLPIYNQQQLNVGLATLEVRNLVARQSDGMYALR